MKFSEFRYERPDIAQLQASFQEALDSFRRAGSAALQHEAMKRINELRRRYSTMANLCHIRHTIDTNDEFYKKEQDFFDETEPVVKGLVNDYYRALVSSPFRAELEQVWGKQLFALAETQLKTYAPVIVEDLQKENKLASEYTKLIASAKIMFEGEERTLAQLQPFVESPDRAMRQRASEARFSFFKDYEKELDELYDELVHVRTAIARKLGFQNFVELGYARLGRTDYNADMVAGYRRQVKTHIVPLAAKLRERQRQRIQVEKLYYYDEPFMFPTGNPTPKGDADWIVQNGRQMYEELSPETGEFFRYMVEHELMDLVAKKGKAGGGYCTYIDDYKAPFIFSNFTGTSGDIDVLTHEAGHAFQVYESRHYDIPEYNWPTLEACEIHSMSMEFFTWPWMELFFGEDADKYRFAHLSDALLFLPYGVAVDEFQHAVYENPDMTPAERKSVWRNIEKAYLPTRDYADHDYLERGGFWQRQGHIYTDPFYYIDYTLAQVCAFQFWKRAQEDRASAWRDYVALCRLGGSRPFTELVKSANLQSPFADGAVASVVGHIERWLDSVDDKAL
ncbi:oligoendopeptidase F [Geobacillus stearothermophilus 10]|nr:oligoendopeptidase F [Geobacillus stearothermophilus 10]